MKYEKPEMEIFIFDNDVTTTDVIVASGGEINRQENNVDFIDPWAS